MNIDVMIDKMDQWFDSLVGHAVFYEVMTVMVITGIALFFGHRLVDQIKTRLAKRHRLWESAFFCALHLPVCILIVLLGFWVAVRIILHSGATLALLTLLEPAYSLVIVALVTLFLWRFIGQVQLGYMHLLHQHETKVDRTTILSLGKVAKVLVLFMALLMTLQTFKVSISGLLAFGGIGTAALAFSAKDLLANFFGGVIVFVDRPFAVGDWIRSPDRNIEGTVEDIGWRLTKIRTFDKRPLYVPNAIFNMIAIENPSRMSNRRIYSKIGLRYQDASKVHVILSDIEAMLRDHPEIDNNQLIMAKLIEFAPSSLTFMVYTFTKTTKWLDFQTIQQDVFLKIVDIVVKNGAEFAFPSSTLYIPDEIKVTGN